MAKTDDIRRFVEFDFVAILSIGSLIVLGYCCQWALQSEVNVWFL
jgi:hypothetical protein